MLEYDKNSIQYSDVISRYMSFVHYIVDSCYSLVGMPDQADEYFVGGSKSMIMAIIKFVRNIRQLTITPSSLAKLTFKRRFVIDNKINIQ